MRQELTQLTGAAATAVVFLLLAWRRGYFCWKYDPARRSNIPLTPGVPLGMVALFVTAVAWLMPYVHQSLRAIGVKTLDLMPWVATGVLFVLAASMLVFLRSFSKSSWKEVWWGSREGGSRRAVQSVGMGLLTWMIAFPAVMLLTSLVHSYVFGLGEEGLEEQVAVMRLKEAMEDPWLSVLTLLALTTAVPLSEELFYRGVIQAYLRKYLPAMGSILLTSLFFAISHYSPVQGARNLELLAGLTLLSLFIGFIYERQRCLWAPIAAHAVFNGVSSLMILSGWK